MKLEITKEEIEAIEYYKDEASKNINQLMSNDIENDLSLLEKEEIVDYSKATLTKNFDAILKIYTAILKAYYNNPQKDSTFYKGTNIAEIDFLKKENSVNKFIIVSKDKESELEKISILNRPAIFEIEIDEKTPYINLNEILENSNETIVAPFLSLEKLEENLENDLQEFKISFKYKELNSLEEEGKNNLYDHIIETADDITEKMKECLELDEQSSIHYENIRKLEQLLAKHHFEMEQETYETETSDEEKQNDIDDIGRINNELDSLKGKAAEVFYKRQENVQDILDWKNDISVYLTAEFYDINTKLSLESSKEEAVDIQENAEEIIVEETRVDEPLGVPEIKFEDNYEENNIIENDIQDMPENDEVLENNEPIIEIDNKEEILEQNDKYEDDENDSPRLKEIKAECRENAAVVDTLLRNIKDLISKQQNHARIAEELGSKYKALNNAFEMRNYAEELEAQLKSIYCKIQITNDEDELEKIAKTNMQISVLLNYLNNAKSANSKGIKRFDELEIIEENELKRGIAETIKNIRCEAELRKLNEDLDIIEEKSSWKKFIGKFTGGNKVDETIVKQIEIRQNAIRKTFKNQMPLAYNYSIHQFIAEIEMFIDENLDDELVVEDVKLLRKIKDTLKKNFVIVDSKVQSIIDRKKGKNLPVSSKKLTKQEIIEIDTYRFLSRYGYDQSVENNEPEYQDTVANEISRIVDYIKSSGIL